MEEITRVDFNRDILNSLVFYFSLGLILAAKGCPEKHCTESLNAFIEEGRQLGYFKNPQVFALYSDKAWRKISAETLEIVEVPALLTEGVTVKDASNTWFKKL